jgi:hypothetical protein
MFNKKDILGLVGIIVIIGCVALGSYVGIYILFWKGIVMLIHGCSSHPLNAPSIAWGIVKIVLAAPVGGTIGLLGIGVATVVGGK